MRTLILLSACAIGLCGCAQSLDAPMSPVFGKAVATMDTQIIPTPVSDEAPTGSGVHGTNALGRYDADKVYKPETQATSALLGATVGYSGK